MQSPRLPYPLRARSGAAMYFAIVLLLMLILPAASVFTEAVRSHYALDLISLIGKWFVFWAVGIRLSIAGIRQVVQPQFTAQEIFDIRDPASFVVVRELGFANLSMGLLGICSLFRTPWIVPAAIVGGLYYGLAGGLHVFGKNKKAKELIAMISDGFAFVVLLVFVVKSVF
jgi:hypothetical protein